MKNSFFFTFLAAAGGEVRAHGQGRRPGKAGPVVAPRRAGRHRGDARGEEPSFPALFLYVVVLPFDFASLLFVWRALEPRRKEADKAASLAQNADKHGCGPGWPSQHGPAGERSRCWRQRRRRRRKRYCILKQYCSVHVPEPVHPGQACLGAPEDGG